MARASRREIVAQALWDAIDWQRTLAQAYAHIPDAPERHEALHAIKVYRHVLNSHYGARPPRPTAKRVEDLPTLTLDQLREANRERDKD